MLGNLHFSLKSSAWISTLFSPTTVDAFVFGYLAPLIHGPASNSGLARYASSRKNLRDFIDRILTVYLNDLIREPNETETSSPTTTTVPPVRTEDRLRDKIAAVTVGILTMCAYAYFSGLIRIEISPVEWLCAVFGLKKKDSFSSSSSSLGKTYLNALFDFVF